MLTGSSYEQSKPVVTPVVAIFLCTYNGERFLSQQLESFTGQTFVNWVLWASDDGSCDQTRFILQNYQSRYGSERVSITDGPKQGLVKNFLSLACNEDIKADYFAFSDQDDIWEPDKLKRATEWLSSMPQDVPLFYCSRTRAVDENDQELGLSPLFKRKPSFQNALVQNIAGGNTIVFNRTTRVLIQKAGADVSVAVHDWWVYLLVTGCGGIVYYDPVPSLRYRQHSENVIGTNSSWTAKLNRVRLMWRGKIKSWNDGHAAALTRLASDLTEANKSSMKNFFEGRSLSLFARLKSLRRSGVYKQTFFGSIQLLTAAIFKKL